MAAPLDRPSSQPKLQEMVDKAIELLSKKSESDPKSKGFFLFYESEVTDSLQHANDIIGTYSGALEISDTATLVKKWYKKLNEKGDDTLFYSTSDHETGGFAIGAEVEDPPTEAPIGWEREFLPYVASVKTGKELKLKPQILQHSSLPMQVTLQHILPTSSPKQLELEMHL